ncbi:MAG: dethiobiotin synthase [Gemmatimonadaceae bacterium]
MTESPTKPRAACRIVAVTGTDTGIGKTVVAAALAARGRSLGLRIAAMKPIESGVSIRESTANGVRTDSAILAEAAGEDDGIELVNPITLEEPLAPMIAAERAGITLDLSILERARETLTFDRDLLVVEGAGGLLSPITRTFSFLQLFKQWDAGLIVVAGNRLGVLNHVMLTISAAESAGLVVHCVVLTDISDHDPSIAEATNYDALVSLLPQYPIYRLPWIDRVHETAALSAAARGAGFDRLLMPNSALSFTDNSSLD